MIKIEPHQLSTFHNIPIDGPSIIKEVSKLIIDCIPQYHTIRIHNATKKCEVTISCNNGSMTIVVRNPDDNVFKLEEPDNAEATGTPGR